VTPETLAWVQVGALVLNSFLVPISWGALRFLWRLDRRVLVIETRLGIKPEGAA
jgi:hypothetical protein